MLGVAAVLPTPELGFPAVLAAILPDFPAVLAALAPDLAAVLATLAADGSALLPPLEGVVNTGPPILPGMALGERLPEIAGELPLQRGIDGPGRRGIGGDLVTEGSPASRPIPRGLRIEALEHLLAHATAHPLDLPGVLHSRPLNSIVKLGDTIGLALVAGELAQPFQSRQTLPITALRVHGAGQQLVGHDRRLRRRLLLLAGNGDVPTEDAACKDESGYGAGTNDHHVRTPSSDSSAMASDSATDGKVGRAAGAMKQISPLLRACLQNLAHTLRSLTSFRPIINKWASHPL
jgi:hypothetical protein